MYDLKRNFNLVLENVGKCFQCSHFCSHFVEGKFVCPNSRFFELIKERAEDILLRTIQEKLFADVL